MKTKYVFIVVLILSFFGVSVHAAEALKIGFVYVSPIGDAGWTFQHDLGRKALEKKFGDKVAVNFVEAVAEGPDSERVIRKYASSRYGLVFTTSFGYMNPTSKVARAYPNVVFEHATGYKKAKNMGNYGVRFYQGRYLAGIAAASKTKSNIMGYVAAFPIPEVVRGINAFILGAQSVNPKVRVKVVWVNSWFNPGKEAEAANSLIAQGADVLTHHTDSVATVKTANDKGVYAIGYHSNMWKYGEKAQIGAVIHKWEQFYTDTVQQVLDGTWKSRSVWGGIPEGMIDFVVTSELGDNIKAKIQAAKNDMTNGKSVAFAGPIYKQDNTQVISQGRSLEDSDLLSMDYFVKGVQGKLSK